MLRQSVAMCALLPALLLADAARAGSDRQFRFEAPVEQQLSLPAAVQVRLLLPDAFEPPALPARI